MILLKIKDGIVSVFVDYIFKMPHFGAFFINSASIMGVINKRRWFLRGLAYKLQLEA